MRYQGIIRRYQNYLPVDEKTPIVSLNEGNTPLFLLDNLARKIGFLGEIWAKFEGLNPTGSFKDRGMTMAVTKAHELGAKAIICASTGNTSASAAAYAAKAGMRCFVLIPEGKVAHGKLIQAVMYGATIIQIEGNFDVGMRLVKKLAETGEVVLVNSVNPYRLQGQKTASFEIMDDLGKAPDYHYLPVGNAGNITAHWMGYCEAVGQQTKSCVYCKEDCQFLHTKTTQTLPKMVGYQASGSAPFTEKKWIDQPETVATAIRIGHPQSWEYAWNVCKESNGWFGSLSDENILKYQRLLAQTEGIFCEPASAVSLGGAVEDIKAKKIPENSQIVCTLTGNGLKDTESPLTAIHLEDKIIGIKGEHVDQFQTLIRSKL